MVNFQKGPLWIAKPGCWGQDQKDGVYLSESCLRCETNSCSEVGM
jgi:hypothetical protein